MIVNFKFREGDCDPYLKLVIPKKNPSIISAMLGDDTVNSTIFVEKLIFWH